MPVEVVGDHGVVGARIERDVLHELGTLPGARDPDGRAQWPVLGKRDSVCLVQQRGSDIERARINVPRVVLLWRVLEGLQLVAATAGSQRLEACLLVIERADAARLGIHLDADCGILNRQPIGLYVRDSRPLAGHSVKHLITERRHILGTEQQLIRIGLLITLNHL